MRHHIAVFVILSMTCMLITVLADGCGRKSNPTLSSRPSASQSSIPGETIAPQPGQIPEEVLLSIKSSECPAGVSDDLWRLLTEELALVIQALGVDKIASAPPTGEQNSVFNLHFDTSAVDTTLAWTHVCIGDYNSDGLVSINDLTPIGQNYLVAIGDHNWAEAQVADGNGDGMITINDITPIGQRYLVQTVEYHVYGSTDLNDYPESDEDGNGGARLVATITFTEGAPGLGNRALFTAAVDAPVAGEYYWVRPSDGETEGSPSNYISANGRGDWWMQGREPTHNSRSIYYGPRSNNVAWSYPTGDEIFAAPVIRADGWIYVGSDDYSLHAVNPQGVGEWTYPTGDYVNAPIIGADGTVYFGSWDGNLYAVNSDGSLVWSHTSGGEAWFNPAIGLDGTIYVGCNDYNVYAILPDETVAWSFPCGDAVRACPTIGPDGTVYLSCRDNNVYAVDSDGNEIWRFATEDRVNASVTLAADGTAYVGSRDGIFYAIDPSGNELWRYEAISSIRREAAIGADGTVYFPSSRYIYALNPDGSLCWRSYCASTIYTAPAIGADGIIYFGNDDGAVYAINPDGSLHWSYSAGDQISKGLAIGADGTLYAGSADGNLYAFNGGENGTPATVEEVLIHDGLEGSELTLSAVVAGTPPVEFTWNFGGGASPNSASEVSPTVTLNEPGVYTCSLTVANDFGAEDNQTFELLVHSAEPPASGWMHSWGSEHEDETNAVVVDSSGNLHFVGITESFDGGEDDVLLLDYAPDGTLLSARTWGTEGVERAYDMTIDGEDNLYIVGRSGDYSESNTLLIKLDSGGDVVWAKTWDSGDREIAASVAVRDDGRIVVVGRTSRTPSGTKGALFLFYDVDGNVTSAAYWDTDTYDEAVSIVTDGAGICYVAGSTANFSEDTEDIVLWRVSNTNTLEWVKSFVTDDVEEMYPDIAMDDTGDLYLTTRRNRLLKYNSLGELQWANSWATEYYFGTSAIAVLGDNLIVGVGVRLTDNWNAGVCLGDLDGNVLWGRHYMTAFDNDYFTDILPVSLDTVYFAGDCSSVYGTWEDIPVESAPVLGADAIPIGAAGFMPAGTEADYVGILADVTGVEDTGGGDDDAVAFCLDLTE